MPVGNQSYVERLVSHQKWVLHSQ